MYMRRRTGRHFTRGGTETISP